MADGKLQDTLIRLVRRAQLQTVTPRQCVDDMLTAMESASDEVRDVGADYLRLAGYAGTDPDGVAGWTWVHMLRAVRGGA